MVVDVRDLLRHRTYVARAVAIATDGVVAHIGADGLAADSQDRKPSP